MLLVEDAAGIRGSHSGGDWRNLVVVCAGSAWDSWFPSEKHVATRLSRWAPVLYVDPPVSAVARRRGSRPTGLRIVGPRMAVLSPAGPPGFSRPIVRHFTARLVRHAIAQAVDSLGAGRAKAIIVANHTDLLDAVDAERRIMYATDDFVAGAGLMKLGRSYLLREQRKQAGHASHVVAVTDQIGEKWRAFGHQPIFIPNGCDTERFTNVDAAPWPDDVDLPCPIAGVFGHLSERIDIRLLETVADRGLSLLLVGTAHPSFELGRLLARPNVRYLGPKPFDMMPGYLRAIEVGLTPYADSAFNHASFPLKTLEYLSAGRAAVSTDLPAVRWLGTELIITAKDPESFADAVERSLAVPRTQGLVDARQAFARRHSWTSRAERFAEILDLA